MISDGLVPQIVSVQDRAPEVVRAERELEARRAVWARRCTRTVALSVSGAAKQRREDRR